MPYCDKPLFPDVFDTLQVSEIQNRSVFFNWSELLFLIQRSSSLRNSGA